MSETKENAPKSASSTVKMLKDCIHAGEGKKMGDKVSVTSQQKKVMQAHGLVAED